MKETPRISKKNLTAEDSFETILLYIDSAVN